VPPASLTYDAARLIYRGFERYLREFDAVTRQAAVRFDAGSWTAARVDAAERLALYSRHVTEVERDLETTLGVAYRDRHTWGAMRTAYAAKIEEGVNWRLAQTWFNSVTRRVWATVGVDREIEFVGSDFAGPEPILTPVVIENSGELEDLLDRVLEVGGFESPWRDRSADLAQASDVLEAALAGRRCDRAEIVEEPFHRGKGCYLVGRLIVGDGEVIPLIVSLRNPDGRLVVDSIITDEDRMSILFSFTRSYFHVRTDEPAALVSFLRTLMPRKRVAELYTSIGFNKHGKSELYRDLLDHLAGTSERFRIARGQRGLVMAVFDMDDYDIVFKIIKDTFPPPKRTTRGQIRAKYRLVFEHDRAGRLVEAHEFEHLSLARDRFEPELLEILEAEASRTVHVKGDRVVIDHAYLERKVTPLDLYVREHDPSTAAAAMIDYGDAIKDLMASDIFPGDMLLKNFGVTRHGRVVFYDYDELTQMQDCTFRPIPEAPTIEDEMADGPWFSVKEGDVFPEEFPRFMGLTPDLRAVFDEHHADLFDYRTWDSVKTRIAAGEVIEIFPYPPSLRLRR
jgi:isocitrate dehydrogenase kinase/phosphatase